MTFFVKLVFSCGYYRSYNNKTTTLLKTCIDSAIVGTNFRALKTFNHALLCFSNDYKVKNFKLLHLISSLNKHTAQIYVFNMRNRSSKCATGQQCVVSYLKQ